MIGIYKITSPRGRVYIGQSRDIEKRFRDYQRLDCVRQVRLHNSLIKHGVDAHTFEVVEECLFEEMNIRERYWQDFYNVLEEGLNCCLTETTDLPRVTSEERKANISKAKLGKKLGPYSEFTCPHCGLVGRGGGMKRYHFDNCTERPGSPEIPRGLLPKATCPHCNKKGSGNVMAQWHFDACKERPGGPVGRKVVLGKKRGPYRKKNKEKVV